MKTKLYFILGLTCTTLGLFIIGKNLYLNNQSTDHSNLVRSHSPRMGAKDPKVVLVEFFDPECESCRAFYPYVKEIVTEFKDDLQLVLRYMPFHRNSKEAIAALEASRVQGLYWESLELLYRTQPLWGSHHSPQIELIYGYLADIGLNIDQLKKEMKVSSIKEIIDIDYTDGKALEVRATPTFFVNGKKLIDFSPKGLRSLIQAELSN